MSKVTIIGYGSFGTALSVLLGNKGHEVSVAARNGEHLKEVAADRENKKYLPGVVLPDNIVFLGDDYETALRDAEFVIFAVPSQTLRGTLGKIKDFIPEKAILVNVAKGIEISTLKRLSQIADEILPNHRFVTLSGPSHAEEVGLNQPTSVVAASEDEEAAALTQELFFTDRFRVYTNNDLLGVELAGALKNIMALGCGIAVGLGFGDNARAALITRGIAEISRLGMAMGGDFSTFAGLAGIGDLIVTCTSMHSRNYRCGIMIGEGMVPEEAQKNIGMVVEGITSCHAAYELAKKYSIEMPITESIELCLKGQLKASEAIDILMGRAPKKEGE